MESSGSGGTQHSSTIINLHHYVSPQCSSGYRSGQGEGHDVDQKMEVAKYLSLMDVQYFQSHRPLGHMEKYCIYVKVKRSDGGGDRRQEETLKI